MDFKITKGLSISLRRLDAIRDYHLARVEDLSAMASAAQLPADAETWRLIERHRAAYHAAFDAIQAYSNGPADPYDSAAARRQLAAAAAEILSEQHGSEKARAA